MGPSGVKVSGSGDQRLTEQQGLGDEAAAGRYIECRLTPLAREVLFNKELTEYIDSYDGRNREPVVFPAKIPVLLAQGAEGIAVGMSTRVLPHNLIELLEAQIKSLNNRNVLAVFYFWNSILQYLGNPNELGHNFGTT